MIATNRKKIGLALGSGGIRGLAHIGVIQSLSKHDIPIDLIAGTSIGALVGGIFAARGDITEVERLYEQLTYGEILTTFSSELFKGDKAFRILQEKIGKLSIESCRIPFCAVASEICSGRIRRIQTGDLSRAIRASASFPLLFKPCKVDDQYCIDGGCAEPVPVETVRLMGADIVIAVNLDSVFFPDQDLGLPARTTRAMSVIKTTTELLRFHLARANVSTAEVVIDPNIHDGKLIRLKKSHYIIKRGEQAADQAIDKIRSLMQ